jgi:hypothetical protein
MAVDLAKEIKKGGSEPPCPFCSLPRVKRSDYIRCVRCGINWLEGEPLDKDPRNLRQRRMIDQMTAMQTKTKKEEPDGR